MPPSKPPSRPVPPRLAALLADQYQIIRELGSGGMATVYLAHDVKHDREVALKVLRPELAAVLGAERFLNEIRITARLDHPHILTLIDSGAADGFLYYVLPYVRGESLRERMVKERQLSLEEALRIGHAGGECARLRRPPGRGASRHQAREHPDPGGGGDPRRLRHRARGEGGGRQPAHRDRPLARHAAVHEPRAGHRRPAARRAQRRLLARRRAVRDDRRRAAALGAHRCRR